MEPLLYTYIYYTVYYITQIYTCNVYIYACIEVKYIDAIFYIYTFVICIKFNIYQNSNLLKIYNLTNLYLII